MNTTPEFVTFVGPMFSGKTSKLLGALEKYKYQQRRYVVFKPRIDDRYSTEEVVTHGGWKIPAVCVKSGVDVIEHLSDMSENPQVIAVDEAFMIPGIAEALIWLFRRGFTVLVSSLEMSSSGKPFGEVEKMLVWSTRVEKCTAVCTVCWRDAHYTHKKLTNDNEIQVGGSELYEPRCAKHFPEIFGGV